MTRLPDPRLRDYLGHMLQAIERIADYTQGMDREGFCNAEQIQEALNSLDPESGG